MAPVTHDSRHVGLGYDSHGELMDAADPIDRFPMLRRLEDYYKDARWSPAEVRELSAHAEDRGVRMEAVCD